MIIFTMLYLCSEFDLKMDIGNRTYQLSSVFHSYIAVLNKSIAFYLVSNLVFLDHTRCWE